MLYRVEPKKAQPFRPVAHARPQILHRGVQRYKKMEDRHSWEKNTVFLTTEEANWINVVNTGFLKARVSHEISILTCVICLSLSLMKEKKVEGRKLPPWKEAQNRQASSRRSFFKSFPCRYWSIWKNKYIWKLWKLEPCWWM